MLFKMNIFYFSVHFIVTNNLGRDERSCLRISSFQKETKLDFHRKEPQQIFVVFVRFIPENSQGVIVMQLPWEENDILHDVSKHKTNVMAMRVPA